MENTATLNKNSMSRPARKKGVFRFYPKSLIAAVLLLVLCFIEYKFSTTYVDEACAVAAFVIMVLSLRKLTQLDIITLLILVVCIVIGLLGNVIFSLNDSVFSVLVDVLSQLKMPLTFFATKYALNEKEKQQTINMLVPFAKVFLAVNAVLAVVAQVFPMGLVSAKRYGLNMYVSVFHFAHQYATVAFVMLGVIVCCTSISEQSRRIFTVFGVIASLATLKSFSIIFTLIFVLLTFYFKRAKKIDLKMILPMLALIILASSYQINTYLVEEDTPRRLFIDYSIVDANQHFPLGSGFATFGSSEAAKNYSPLYYEYGFNEIWGMNPANPAFLVDTYWPTVIGQLGWIGAGLFILVYVRIFINLGYSTESGPRRAFLYAMFAQYMIHAIGSAILQSSTGMLGFMLMSLCTIVDSERENAHRKVKFHIET